MLEVLLFAVPKRDGVALPVEGAAPNSDLFGVLLLPPLLLSCSSIRGRGGMPCGIHASRELAFKDYAVAVVPAHCRQCIPAMLLVAGKGYMARVAMREATLRADADRPRHSRRGPMSDGSKSRHG